MKKLERAIKGKNALNLYIIDVLNHVLPQLPQYMNKKVLTVNGDKSKLFVIDMGNILPFNSDIDIANGHLVKPHRCYITKGYGKTLKLNISICLSGGSNTVYPSTAYCEYFEREIEIANLNDENKLISIGNIDEIIENYGFDNFIDMDAEKVKIHKLKELEKQMEAIRDTIKVSPDYYKYL